MQIIPGRLTDTFLSQAHNNSIPQVVNEYFEGQDTVHMSFHERGGIAVLTYQKSSGPNTHGMRGSSWQTETARAYQVGCVSINISSAVFLTFLSPGFQVQGPDQFDSSANAWDQSGTLPAPSRPPSRAQNRSPLGKMIDWTTNYTVGTDISCLVLISAFPTPPAVPLKSRTYGLRD